MTYVIAQPWVDVQDRSCIDECPVDCIYEGAGCSTSTRMSVLIVARASRSVRSRRSTTRTICTRNGNEYTQANLDFFSELGSPGGASKVGSTANDPPLVATLPPQAADSCSPRLRSFVP
jgi:hypothetical protein